jgi:hypothetical protein
MSESDGPIHPMLPSRLDSLASKYDPPGGSCEI